VSIRGVLFFVPKGLQCRLGKADGHAKAFSPAAGDCLRWPPNRARQPPGPGEFYLCSTNYFVKPRSTNAAPEVLSTSCLDEGRRFLLAIKAVPRWRVRLAVRDFTSAVLSVSSMR
jgi:hypothetical protein